MNMGMGDMSQMVMGSRGLCGTGVPMMGSMCAMGVGPSSTVIAQAGNGSLDVPDVLAAIESLYKDELKPFGRILRKRLAERAAALGLGAIDVDIRRLRQVCESLPVLCVQVEEGGDWSAVVRYRPSYFVDVYSPQDNYLPELWKAAAEYFGSLTSTSMALPGGRYSCAQALASRGLPFLAGLSLGQVCHIVQLAISQKKLLGYLNGAVVPYSRSQSMVKERCAERGKPCTSAARGISALATWDTVRTCLQDIFKNLPPGSSTVPLSNVKRLFRSKFHIELSETVLGHAKLSELLQDQRLHDICTVRLQGHGYVVIPLKQRPAPHLAPYTSQASPVPLPSKPQTPESPQQAVETPKLPEEPRAPAKSLRERAKWVQPLCIEEETLPRPPRLMAAAAAMAAQWLPSSAEARLSPGALRRCRSTPGLGKDAAEYQIVENDSCSTYIPGTPQSSGSQQSQAVAVSPRRKDSPGRPLLTPSTLGNLGYSVHNTFIHANLPVSPVGAGIRSQSLPRNMGSRRRVVVIHTPIMALGTHQCFANETACDEESDTPLAAGH